MGAGHQSTTQKELSNGLESHGTEFPGGSVPVQLAKFPQPLLYRMEFGTQLASLPIVAPGIFRVFDGNIGSCRICAVCWLPGFDFGHESIVILTGSTGAKCKRFLAPL